MSSVLTLTMALTTITGCAQSPTTIKAPVSSGSSTTVAQEPSVGEPGLTAGFALNHDEGLKQNGNMTVYQYDYQYYYLNEMRQYGPDPGAWYCSEEDILDSYTKLLNREKDRLGEAKFTQANFDAEYGTWDYWKERYANKFFVVTTNSSGSLTSATKQKYPTAQYGAFLLRSSSDLNNWEQEGEIDGYALMVENDSWMPGNWAQYCWAPEFQRDPITGLYILAGSSNSKSGSAATEYNPSTTGVASSTTEYDKLSLLLAISPNPVGPYKLITADEYYSYLAEYDDNGEIETVVVGEGEDAKEMAVYRNDLLDDLAKKTKETYAQGEKVALTQYKDGEFLNQNGDPVKKTSLPLNFQYYHDLIIEAFPHWTIDGRGLFPAIDINPVVDQYGEIYIYFSSHGSSVFGSNRIWVIHMLDWATPDWDSLTNIAAPSYSIIYNDGVAAEGLGYREHTKQLDGSYTYKEVYSHDRKFAINGIKGYYMGYGSEQTVNEGAFVIEKDGWYYLTYSPYGYGGRWYSVYMAVSNNPYGPFIKMPEYSPILGGDLSETADYMTGTGHHAFIWAGDELYAVYHAFLNAEDNYNHAGEFLGRGIAFDRVDWYDYDQVTFGSLIEKQIDNDMAAEAKEDITGVRADNMPEEFDYDVTEEWIRNVFVNCNNSYYFGEGEQAQEKYEETYNKVVPLLYANGPTHSLQPVPEVSLPDGLTNVANDEDVTVEVLYGDTATALYANDGMVTHRKWSGKYEVAGNAAEKQLKLKLKFGSPKTIRNIMIFNSRNYVNGFKSVSSIVFKLAQKPTWYPEDAAYNGYCYIKDLKADPYGWDDTNQFMRKGGSALANFYDITVSEITITISADDMISSLLGKNLVKLSEIYIIGKNA